MEMEKSIPQNIIFGSVNIAVAAQYFTEKFERKILFIIFCRPLSRKMQNA